MKGQAIVVGLIVAVMSLVIVPLYCAISNSHSSTKIAGQALAKAVADCLVDDSCQPAPSIRPCVARIRSELKTNQFDSVTVDDTRSSLLGPPGLTPLRLRAVGKQSKVVIHTSLGTCTGISRMITLD